MKKLLLITYLIPLFFSIAVASQDAQNEQLAELLEKLDGGPGSLSDSAVLQPDAEGYSLLFRMNYKIFLHRLMHYQNKRGTT